MKASIFSLYPALAVGMLTVLGASANAEELDPITVSAPVVKSIGRDALTEIPIQSVTVKAQIAADAETLRNHSGVVLLHDRVLEAARKACYAADPYSFDDSDCVHQAVKAAQPQIAAAVAGARRVRVAG